MNLCCRKLIRGPIGPLGYLTLAAVLLAASGCTKPVASISGKVTFDGKALTEEEINFIGEDGKARSSVISTHDGSYHIADAPVGKVKVSVVSFKLVGEGGRFDLGLKVLKTPPTA